MYVCNLINVKNGLYNINALTYGEHHRTNFSYVTQENWFRPMKEPTVCNAKPTILSERCQNVLQCKGKINLRP